MHDNQKIFSPRSHYSSDFDRLGNRDWNPKESRRDLGYAGKGPKGYERSSERILNEVCHALSENSWVDASDIEVKVEDGCVHLSGTVESRDQKKQAEACAEEIRGVEDVINHLRINTHDTKSYLST